jgi:hypothetical protein
MGEPTHTPPISNMTALIVISVTKLKKEKKEKERIGDGEIYQPRCNQFETPHFMTKAIPPWKTRFIKILPLTFNWV